MIDKQDSITEDIALGIENRLSQAGVDFSVDMRELIDNEAGSISLPRPVGNISINQGTYKRANMNTKYNSKLMVHFLLLVSETRERENRRAILKLIHAFDRILFHADIGVPLQDRLEPTGFNNLTDIVRMSAGLMLYQLTYTCGYNFRVEPDDEVDLGAMTKIYNSYFLQHPSDDGVADVEGQVVLDEIGGGDPASVGIDGEEIFGGTPGDVFDKEDDSIYGGSPEST